MWFLSPSPRGDDLLPAVRGVVCVACARPFDVAAKAIRLTCPGCCHRCSVQDWLVDGTERQRQLHTAASIVVRPGATLMADSVAAGLVLEVHGQLIAREVRAGRLWVAPGATLAGVVTTGSVAIGAGANLESATLSVGLTPFGGPEYAYPNGKIAHTKAVQAAAR